MLFGLLLDLSATRAARRILPGGWLTAEAMRDILCRVGGAGMERAGPAGYMTALLSRLDAPCSLQLEANVM